MARMGQGLDPPIQPMGKDGHRGLGCGCGIGVGHVAQFVEPPPGRGEADRVAQRDRVQFGQDDPQRLYEAMQNRDAASLGQQTYVELRQATTEQSRPTGTC